jgi:diguanylate cyclase (GGDEF)-like protein
VTDETGKHFEATLLERSAGRDAERPEPAEKACCLVQIYPTDVIDGLQKVDRPIITLGRDAKCDIVLDDPNVSRLHARLERVDGGYVLVDLESTNGTFVDEQPIARRRLNGGEALKFGSFIFKFLAADCLEAQYHETVYAAMTRDGLTKAFNKNYLIDSLNQELARRRRSDRPLAIVMLDIDRFKSINDGHGHLVGDEVLKEFASRLQQVSRAGDLFCRYGGEEFVMVLGETDLIDAIGIAERCRREIQARPFSTADGPLEVTTSLGVSEASLVGAEATPAMLLKLADEELYRAKRSGRNRVCAPGYESRSE